MSERVLYLLLGIAAGIVLTLTLRKEDPSIVESSHLEMEQVATSESIDKSKVVTREVETVSVDGTKVITRDIVETKDVIAKISEEVKLTKDILSKTPVPLPRNEIGVYCKPSRDTRSCDPEYFSYSRYVFDSVGAGVIVSRDREVSIGIVARW